MGTQADALRIALTKAIRQARNDTCVEVTANLREPPDEGGTPVDSGWARANWIPTIAQPAPDAVGSETAVSSAESAQREGLAVVATYAGQEPVFVTNNVPYIARLNNGWSQQAPAAFVERAVAKAEQTMEQLHRSAQIEGLRADVTLPRPRGS